MMPRITTTRLVLLAGLSLVALLVVTSLTASAQNQRRISTASSITTAPLINPQAKKMTPVEVSPVETIQPGVPQTDSASKPPMATDPGSQVATSQQTKPDDDDGKLRFENAQTSLIQNAFVAAPMAGVVDGVSAREGQMVYLDAPLVRLQSELAEKELVAARAAHDAAVLESDNDVDLRYARRTLQVRENEMRQSQLANRTYAGAVSEMELEELRLKVDQAALATEQAEHDLMIAAAAAIEKETAVSIAKTKLDRHTIRTTVAGMVTEVAVQPGEWVEAGEPLVRIISLDPLRVECFVDGRKHGQELVGRDVQFVPASIDASVDDNIDADQQTRAPSLPGSITFVSPELNPVTGQVRVWATVRNHDGKIGSGTPGSLQIK